MVNAIDLCNCCDASPANPTSAAGYCDECLAGIAVCGTCLGSGYVADGDEPVPCDDRNCGYWKTNGGYTPRCAECGSEHNVWVDPEGMRDPICDCCAEGGDTAPRDWKDVYK